MHRLVRISNDSLIYKRNFVHTIVSFKNVSILDNYPNINS